MFGKSFKPAVAAIALLIGAGNASATGLIQLEGVQMQPNLPDLVVRPNLPAISGAIGINCPAPAVRSMTAHRIGGDMVRIVAEIANIGGVNFQSGEGQQLVTLSDGRGRPVGYRGFVTLAAGDSFTFSTERRWNPASEFQEGFSAHIDYAPDIFIDANPANDDCRMGDNARSITPAEINALFN